MPPCSGSLSIHCSSTVRFSPSCARSPHHTLPVAAGLLSWYARQVTDTQPRLNPPLQSYVYRA